MKMSKQLILDQLNKVLEEKDLLTRSDMLRLLSVEVREAQQDIRTALLMTVEDLQKEELNFKIKNKEIILCK